MLSSWELFAVILAGFAATVAIRRLVSARPIPGIPHLPITSFLGDIPEMGEAIKKHKAVIKPFFEKHALELGPIYQTFIGPKVMVVVSDPYEMEDVLLRSRSKYLATSSPTMGIFGGIIPYSQIALPTNDLWKKHRRVSGPSMSPTFLRQGSSRIANNALALVNYWKDKMNAVNAYGGRSFECSLDFSICTLDIIGELIFGETVDGISDLHSTINEDMIRAEIDEYGGTTFPACKSTTLHQAISYYMKALTTAANLPSFLMKAYWFYTRRTKLFRTHDTFVKDLIRSRIKEARARVANVQETGSDMADCIVDMIIEKEQREGANKQSDQELLDELIGFVLAGHDTTAAASAFGLIFLTNHPEVQKNLRRELISNLNEPEGRPLTYDDVCTDEKTPYLEAVAHEILRCADITVTSRQVLEDMVILGKNIPKGTELLFLTGLAGRRATNSYSTRRSETIASDFRPTKGAWRDDDVSEFKPERWLISGPDGRRVFSASQGYSIPFGIGNRSCFGSRLALLELKMMIATINLGVFLESIPDELNNTEGYYEITVKPKQAYISLVDWEDVKDA